MAYAYDNYDAPMTVAQAVPSARAAFIRRTYLHLAGAILAFVALEFAIFGYFGVQTVMQGTMSFFSKPFTQLILLVGFIGVGYMARYWAQSRSSVPMQYLGLGLYVVFEALIFIPILAVAAIYGGANVIPTAGILTLCVFGGLTVAAFITRKDFAFLGPILSISGFLMLGLVVIGMVFPQYVSLGMWFSFLAVAIACAYILYDTSNVIHHYSTDMHVAASLELFAAVAYLFYYILRILLQMSDRR